MRAYASAGAAVLFVIAVALLAAAPPVSAAEPAGAEPPDFSFSDLMGSWGSAMIDPYTYTAWAHMGGFFEFLKNETFLSAFSSSSYGSLDRDTILGTVPNIFFVVCILVAILSVAVSVIEVKKLEASKRVIRRSN